MRVSTEMANGKLRQTNIPLMNKHFEYDSCIPRQYIPRSK
jgi:hypothetical protein